MSKDIKIDNSKFELPDNAKAEKVFDRLVRINAAVTDNGLHEAYYERHSKYEERYGVMF